MKTAVLFTTLGGVSAFAPVQQSSTTSVVQLSETKADLEEIAGKLNPIVKVC